MEASPRKFWGGAIYPLPGWPGPEPRTRSSLTRHGLPSSLTRHGLPSSLTRHGLPSFSDPPWPSRAPWPAMASRAPWPAMASRAPWPAMASRALWPAMASRAPCSAMVSRVPGSAMASRPPRSAMAPSMGAALEASCPVLSPCPLRPPERPPPPPRWMVYGAGRTVREGGVLSVLCSPCHVFPLLSCPYLVSSCSCHLLLSVPSPVLFKLISPQPCVVNYLL